MIKIAFIVSGLIGRKKAVLADINRHFSNDAQLNYEVFETQYARHAELLAKQVFEQGFEYIVSVGGDGTLNEVVNGVFNACRLPGNGQPSFDQERLKQCKLGVYPAGSGNDFSRTIKVRPNALELKHLIKENQYTLIDMGFGSFRPLNGEETGWRIFANVTDVGMGGAATFYLAKIKSKSWLTPTLQYAKAIVKTFLSYRKQEVAFTGTNLSWQGKLMSLVMANGKYFGSGLGIAPYAELNNGQLSVVILGNVTLYHYISYLPKLRQCKIIDNPEIKYFNDEDIEIRSLEAPLYMQMDGELVGTTPARVSVIKQCIHFLMPQ
ncbi:hypothetical protein C7N43_31905 [Sphingobacteriales bacterium UPWRP_1]|nr:hypothetical protein BVG80_07855 [Sphingobacteriales bacterium TSM_CSM]PSJ72890.1 hypothetical protein C7N43_31905 [Sphingobacteriales bacterium UPWRP_1]